MKINFTFFLLAAVMLVSCGPNIYKSSNFNSVTAKHHLVAILPAEVTLRLRPNEMKHIEPEQFERMQDETGYDVQDKLYGWFLRRSEKYRYTVDFQDVSKTNSIIRKLNLNRSDLMRMPREQLADILGVDAVITTTLHSDKPMNEGVALATGILFNTWAPTNRAFVNIKIHEARQGDLIWNYDYEASGSVGSSPERLVNEVMRNASRKFPYNAR